MTTGTVAWDAVEREAAETLSRYIQINTTNPPGNETEGACFLKDILEKEHIAADLYESMPGRGSLVSRYRGDRELPDLLLLHHIDVVPAEQEKWRYSPFSGASVGGEIWGRGALDCKFLGIMEFMAFILLKREGLCPEKYMVLAATADEEAGGAWGVRWLMENHPGLLAARYVINEGVGWGFDTGLCNLCLCQVAEKGACWMRITFSGRPGHASLPHDENCVVHMARAVELLSGSCFPVRVTAPVRKLIQGLAPVQELMPPEEFLRLLNEGDCRRVLEGIREKTFRHMLAATLRDTAVPTVASAGSKVNVIPGECYCEVDCRILPGTDPDELAIRIRELLEAGGCRNFTVAFKGKSQSSVSPTDTPLYRALEDSFTRHDPRARVVPYMSPGATDSRFFRARGIPAYGLQFDASIEATQRIHGHNERISIEQLIRGTRVLYDTARRFCSL